MNDVAACQELRWSQFSFHPLSPPKPPASALIPPITPAHKIAAGPPLIARLAGAKAGPGVRLEVRKNNTGEEEGNLPPHFTAKKASARLVLYDVEEKRPHSASEVGTPQWWYGNQIRRVVLQERQREVEKASRDEARGVVLQFPFGPSWSSAPISLEDLSSSGVAPVGLPAFGWASQIVSPSPKEPYPMLRFLFHPTHTHAHASSALPTEPGEVREDRLPRFVPQYIRGSIAIDPSPITTAGMVSEVIQPSSPLLIASTQEWEENETCRRIRLNVAYGRVIPPPPPRRRQQRGSRRRQVVEDEDKEVEDEEVEDSNSSRRARLLLLDTPQRLTKLVVNGGVAVWTKVRRELFGWVRILQVEAAIGGGGRRSPGGSAAAAPKSARGGNSATPFFTVTDHDALKIRLGGVNPRWSTALHLRHSEVLLRAPGITSTTTATSAPIAIPDLPLFSPSSQETVWSAFLSREYDSATRHYTPLTPTNSTEGDVSGATPSVGLVASALRVEAGAGVSMITAQNSGTMSSARGRCRRDHSMLLLPKTGVLAKAVSEGWCTFALPYRFLLTCRQHSGVLWSHPLSHSSPSPYLNDHVEEEGSTEGTVQGADTTLALSHGLLTTGHTLSWPAHQLRGWIYTGNEKGLWQDPRARCFTVFSAELSRAPDRHRGSSNVSSSAQPPAHELTEESVRTRGSRRQWSLFANVGWMGIPVKGSLGTGSNTHRAAQGAGAGNERLWPKASVGLAIASNVPQLVLDTFSGLQYMRQELTLSWMVDFSKSPVTLRATAGRGSSEQMGPVWKRGTHEFFQHFRIGITWKW